MKKTLYSKLMAIVLVAVMIFGGIDATAYAAKKISVEGVYTNFLKATMVIGTTRQIITEVEPKNASEQRMKFKSSNTEIVMVSGTGLLTAIAPGKATVTVTAMDGSNQTETVKVTVLKDLILTKKNIDADNEVIVMDQTYGNVTVDETVGDAVIYLSQVTMKGNLLLEQGKYTVNMMDSSVKKVLIDEPKLNSDEVITLAVAEENTAAPTLNINGTSDVKTIEAKINAFIKQADQALIDSISFIQEYENKTVVYLEGFTGTLSVDASTAGNIVFVAKGCNIPSVTVNGQANTGSVQFNNDGDTQIGNVTVQGAANLELNVPVTKVDIDQSASGARVCIKDSVEEVVNAGTGSQVDVQGSVTTINSNGTKAYISAGDKASVVTINVNGSESTVTGHGEIAEVYVNADSVSVNTINSLVTIGDVKGTKVQGEEKKGGTALTSNIPAPPTPVDSTPKPILKAGDTIVDNSYEDSKNDLISTMGTCSMTKKTGEGKDGGAGLLVENRTANYHGVGYDFGAYVNKHITLRVKFDIKTNESGTLKATFKSNVGYNSIASVDATAGTWYSMEGTYPLDNTVTSAFMYIEHSVGTAKYTIDNVKITIDSIGDKIPVSGVALNQDSINLNIGQTANLIATISPNTADNKNVSWSSDHTSVATVANGVVSAVSAGIATITVTTEDGSKTATCAVTVSSSVQLVLNYGTVLLQSIGATKTAVTNVSGTTTWTSSDPAVATVAGGVITAVSNGSATVTASVGGSTASCNVIVADNIVLYEDFESGTNSIPNQGDWAVATEILTDEASAYNGGKYLKVTNKNLYNGNLITLDNTAGITAANYVITSYVKAVGANVGVQYFHDNSALGYTIASVTATPTEWAKIENSVLTVAAGSSLVVRIITDAADSTDKTAYYMDSIYITRTPDTGSHPITGVTLNKSVLSLNKSASETLLATIAPVNYSTSGTIHWTSSNSSIAMVDSTGKVTAVASGTAIIYAETAVDGASTTAYTAQCEVTVTETVSVPVLDLTETLETTNPFDAYKSIGNFGNTGGGVRAVTGSAISPVGYKSDKCLQITGTADWHGISYWINNTNSVEVTYTFSARVKLVSGADAKVRIQTSERVHNDTDPYKEDIFNILADSWTLVSTAITIPAGVSISMELKPTTSNELIFLVDDIHISN